VEGYSVAVMTNADRGGEVMVEMLTGLRGRMGGIHWTGRCRGDCRIALASRPTETLGAKWGPGRLRPTARRESSSLSATLGY